MNEFYGPPAKTMMSRLKDRLLHPWTQARDDSALHTPAVRPPRPLGFPASIAEFLLVLRLRARRRTALSGGMLERAVHVLLVTCKNWFGDSTSTKRGPRKP